MNCKPQKIVQMCFFKTYLYILNFFDIQFQIEKKCYMIKKTNFIKH
jgi:hypothetical protein